MRLPVRFVTIAAALCLAHCALADVFSNIAEAAGYTLVYSLAIPDSPNFSSGVPYSVDNSGSVANGSFDRIGYYLELQSSGGPLEYVYVSVDAFTNDATQIGVPTVGSGEFFQMALSNMNVISDAPGIVTGAGISTGNIEFWPTDYDSTNSNNVPNASDSVYDWGDNPVNDGAYYGSMQIANYGASQMLFSFNDWNSGSVADLGIGNQPSGNPDWTFANNASDYTVKNLEIVVGNASSVPEPGPALPVGMGLLLAALTRGRVLRGRARFSAS